MRKGAFSAVTVIALLVVLLLAGSAFAGCAGGKKEILIYTSAEDYRVEYMQKRLDETFPDYKITLEYMSTGNHAAKLMAEGTSTACDICYDLEYGYMEQLAEKGVFADLTGLYDTAVFAEDALVSPYFLPEYRNGCAIIVNPTVLEAKGLPAPKSYDDLLDPMYKGLIMMPSPKASGTGYAFLLARVNELGEDAAFAYFDALTENILQYSSSGSGPVNALVLEEVAIGMGITGQAVTQINEGAPLEISYFEQGSPFAMYGQAIIAGRETDPAVKAVFDFLINTYGYENCQNFFPERIYRDKTFVIENYPEDIVYADMSGNTIERKETLLARWVH